MNIFEVMTGQLSRMSYVNRYSSFPVNRRENVAEHSWWVAFIAYVVSLELADQRAIVSVGHVLEYALMHDISEVVSGDVIRSYKHSRPEIKRAMQDADWDNTSDMVNSPEFGSTAKRVFDAWRFAKADTTLEGQIVAFADMAAVAFYCREEYRSGNRAIRAVLKEAYESWFFKYHEHPLLGQFIDQIFPSGRFYDALREDDMYARPMMSSHSEGPTSEELDWHGGSEVPLG